jgi:hypothetical protein
MKQLVLNCFQWDPFPEEHIPVPANEISVLLELIPAQPIVSFLDGAADFNSSNDDTLWTILFNRTIFQCGIIA